MSEFIKGMDISTLEEVERLGAIYKDEGKEYDLLDLLGKYGVNYIRLRLWINPYDEQGRPYGAGCNDLKVTMNLARRIKEHGMKFLLDFHYSDFWTDPGKQIIPKEWKGLGVDELEQKMYEYTYSVLTQLKAEALMPDMVAVGNELSNGLLWPYGKVPEYDNIAKFIKAGVRAVRDISSDIQVMIHLDNGGNNNLYREWFDNFNSRGGDYDVIGMSYYPFWHGTLTDLEDNINDVARRYGKKIIIAEVSMGYTMADYGDREGLPVNDRQGMATKQELVEKLGYSMTEAGQCMFLSDFQNVLKNSYNKMAYGYFYWEPAWLPVKGSTWATRAGMDYIGEDRKEGNEWANQALFDYDGNALPSLKVIESFEF